MHVPKPTLQTISKDSVNSRMLQQRLQIADDIEKQMIFDSIYGEALFLMKDQFGNYLIQKFFEFGLKSQQQMLLDLVFIHIIELSFDMYGCRVV
jgi:pumilio RNA-binding family